MSKRRRASELILKSKRGLKYPAKVVARTSGTGTEAAWGIITVVTGTRAYFTAATATNIGTLIGTF